MRARALILCVLIGSGWDGAVAMERPVSEIARPNPSWKRFKSIQRQRGDQNQRHQHCPDPKDHRREYPIALKGRLAVSYVENSIDPQRGDNHELGVFDLEDPFAGIRRLSKNLVNESEIEISPDGTKFLYTVRRELDDFHNVTQFYQMNMDGSGKRLLIDGDRMSVPAWLQPLNDVFLFIRWADGQASRLFTMNTKTKKVAPYLDVVNAVDPEVSYDGRQITFKRNMPDDRDSQPSIFVMNSDGTGLRRLTYGWSDHDPVFNRDGTKIYFERYYGPGDWFEASKDRSVPEHNWWGIVEVDVLTGKERVIMPHDPCGRHFYWLPTMGPDFDSIMFIHIDVWGEDHGRPWTDLWVTRLDGSDPQKVPGSDWIYFFDWTK